MNEPDKMPVNVAVEGQTVAKATPPEPDRNQMGVVVSYNHKPKCDVCKKKPMVKRTLGGRPWCGECPDPTHIRVQGRTGRNEPCPCGSKKKFKKCCLGKVTTNAADIL